MENKLTYLEAFNSMRHFLERYYERTKSNDIGSLLGDLQLLQDMSTADPAAWHNWIKSVEETLSKGCPPLGIQFVK
ncbi:MAG: hypothetical protein ABIQ95_10845 [Bdellovibrionia bacterium]